MDKFTNFPFCLIYQLLIGTHDVECTMEDNKSYKRWVFREFSGTVTTFLVWKAEEFMVTLTNAEITLYSPIDNILSHFFHFSLYHYLYMCVFVWLQFFFNHLKISCRHDIICLNMLACNT